GVSVGEFDFMRDFVRKSGELLVDKCAIKPGRHIKIARICGENSKVKKIVFALPGFSYSAITTAILFVRPYVYRLFGAKMDFEKTAVLAEDYELKGQLENFSAASLSVENGKLLISTKGKKQGSSAISTNLLDLAVLLRLSSSAKKGEIVRYIEI
ncbi:MAG: molybdopterin molybdenumtransferase MoeA, partial [Campylobacter sp.]|nr:molybdopterin molybdenumtransferase MoeA [Campylobacter sp.]